MTDDLLKKLMAQQEQQNMVFNAAINKSVMMALGPVLDRIERNSSVSKQDLIRALTNIKVSVSPQVNIPAQVAPQVRVTVPDVHVPTPQVTVQAARSPDIHIPPTVFPTEMQTTLKGVNYKTPLPVMVTNQIGGPRGGLSLSDIVTPSGDSVMDSVNKAIKVNVVAGSVSLSGVDTNIGPSGANTLRVTIATDSNASVNITGSTGTLGVNVVDSTGVPFDGSNAFPVSITGSTGTLGASLVDSSGVQYSGSNPLPTTATLSLPSGQGDAATATRVVVAGNSDMSVVVNSILGLLLEDHNIGPSGANTLRTTVATDAVASMVLNSIVGPVAQGDTASALRVVHAGDSQVSIQVNGFNNGAAIDVGSGPSGTQTLRVTIATDANSSVSITGSTGTIAAALVDSTGVEYSGSNPLPIVGPVVVTSVTNTIASNIVDSGGVAYSGSNPLPIVGPVVVTSVTNTIAANIVDSTGVPFEGANALPITVAGATASIVVVGDIPGGSADDGSPPLKQGAIAASTNHTRVTDGQRVSVLADLAGRLVVIPQVPRQLQSDANVLLTRGALTSILTAGASTFIDLMAVSCANNSTNAVQVLLYESDSGSNVYTVNIPASATAGISFQVPLAQTTTAQTWTAKVNGTDISDSNVTLFLEGIQNI